MSQLSLESDGEDLYFAAQKALRYLQNKRHYRYVEFLDEGGYGWVALMYDDAKSKLLAIKCTNEPGELELSHWPKLHHPNILPLLEIITMDDSTVFIMPAQRKDLFKHIVNTDFYQEDVSFGMCRVWMKDVATGLAYMHAMDLCHLDLKLDNIFLKDNGHVCVGDFSLLSHVHGILPGMEFLEMQRPPEHTPLGEEDGHDFDSQALNGERVDMWQFGIVCVDLLTDLKLSSKTSSFAIWDFDILPFVQKLLERKDYWKNLLEKCFGREILDEELNLSHDFISRLLAFEAGDRMTADSATRHGFADVHWPAIQKTYDFERFDPVQGRIPNEVVVHEVPQLDPIPGMTSPHIPECAMSEQSHNRDEGVVKSPEKKKLKKFKGPGSHDPVDQTKVQSVPAKGPPRGDKAAAKG